MLSMLLGPPVTGLVNRLHNLSVLRFRDLTELQLGETYDLEDADLDLLSLSNVLGLVALGIACFGLYWTETDVSKELSWDMLGLDTLNTALLLLGDTWRDETLPCPQIDLCCAHCL